MSDIRRDLKLLQSLIDNATEIYEGPTERESLIILTPMELGEILSLHDRIIRKYPLYVSFRNEAGEIEFRLAETSDCEEHF